MTEGLLFYYSVYDGPTLWRFISHTMRPWWIDEIKAIRGRDGSNTESEYHPFGECTLNNPPPIFQDKTKALMRFNNDYNSGDLARVVDAMNNQEVMNLNVLCPWNCSASCQDAGEVPLDVMIQRMLPKIVLPLWNSSLYNRVQYSCNQYFSDENDYPTILLNDKWVVKPSIKIGDDGVVVITCKYHDNGQDRLTLFAPRSPHQHILNAKQPDQLAHCITIPRVSKQTQAKQYCTKFGVTRLHSNYSGVDTMNIGNHSDFSKTSELLSQHESASIVGRQDISILLSKKVSDGEISQHLVDSYINSARSRFTPSQLRQYTQGSTFVRFDDMVRIHLHESSSTSQTIQVLNDRPNRGSRQPAIISTRRSWPIGINLLQTEDASGYGTQFRAIPQFSLPTQVPSASTWSLFAILSSCPALWRAVDMKQSIFRFSGWEGWLLTAINALCFQFHSIQADSRSPIKRLTSLKAIAEKVNPFVVPSDIEYEDEDEDTGPAFYHCGIKSFQRLFPSEDYGDSLSILESINEATANSDDYAQKKVIIVVGDNAPTSGNVLIGTVKFELQVICVLKADKKGKNVNDYDAIRFMRHPGCSSYWKQGRRDALATQCIDGENIYDSLLFPGCYFLQYISVYVKIDDECIDQWKSKVFESMGGKSHAVCECNKSPLIPTNCTSQSDKAKCNAKHFVGGDGSRYENPFNDCRRKEAYICTNVYCGLKICKRCYDSLLTNEVTTVIPCNNQSGGDHQYNHSSTIGGNEQRDDEEEQQHDDNEHRVEGNNNDDDDDDSTGGLGFLLPIMQDTTLDRTMDNQIVVVLLLL